MKRKTNKHKNVKRKNNRKTKAKRTRGGCGCNNGNNLSPGGLITGGGDFFLPGPPLSESINGLPLHAFYPENKFEGGDPQGSQISSRLIGGGGGKKSKKRKGKKNSIKKGGNFSDYISNSLDSVPNNPISFFGTTSGASYSNDIVNGYSNDNNTLGVRSHFAGPTMV